jgi:phosphate transport system permease protein
MTTTLEEVNLKGSRLPRWFPLAAAAASIGLAYLTNLLTPVQGVAGTALVAGVLFLVLQTTASFLREGVRYAKDRLAATLIYVALVMALVPLVAILADVVIQGLGVISPYFLTHSMRNVPANAEGGGIYHAIIGTLEQVAIAAVLAIPLGIMAAVYLTEFGRGTLARAVSFFVDVMTGVPSIVAGLFIYSGVILIFGFERIGVMGALALALLMIPIVVRSAEEMIRLVPRDLREASYALGVPQWKTILRVVLPTARNGLITGVMLAVARVAGETAPLLLTVFLSQSINYNPFSGAQASLPTFVWDQVGSSSQAAVDRAWGAALVLIVFVLLLNVIARGIARLATVGK